MKCWYYLDQGKTCGPIVLEDLIELIELGKVCAYDLLSWKKSDWKYAYEFQDVYSHLQGDSSDPGGKDWVVMKFSADGARKQQGPWSTSGVKKAIASGQVHYQDLIWRSGMAQWYSIAQLPEFNPPSQHSFFCTESSERRESFPGPAKPYMIMTPPPAKRRS